MILRINENQQFIRFGQHKDSCFLFWFQHDVYRRVNIYEGECDVVSHWSSSNLLVGDDACAVFGLVKHWEVLKLDSIHLPCLEVLLGHFGELLVKEVRCPRTCCHQQLNTVTSPAWEPPEKTIKLSKIYILETTNKTFLCKYTETTNMLILCSPGCWTPSWRCRGRCWEVVFRGACLAQFQ